MAEHCHQIGVVIAGCSERDQGQIRSRRVRLAPNFGPRVSENNVDLENEVKILNDKMDRLLELKGDEIVK